MKWKRIPALLLVMLLVLSAAAHPQAAKNLSTAEKYNIVIVTDCSTSLIKGNKSDPEAYRFEAISMFLGLLTESGNNVSAIVFNGTTSTTDNSDESMRQGLRLNTELAPLNGMEEKQALVEQIRDVPAKGYTDIGTALLAAAEKLDGMTAENGLRSIILLFTDGYTETKDKQDNPDAPMEELPVYSKSIENGNKAVEIIRENEIMLCGVYLQGESKDSENSEVLDLVRRANNIPDTASAAQVKELYIPVKEASSLPDAYKKFFTVISGTEAEPFEGEKEFTIPGKGVTDVNISLLISDVSLRQARRQLDDIQVTITRPDKSVMDTREMSRTQYAGRNFLIYKLQEPQSGVWTVRVEAPEGVELESSLIINADVSAVMELDVSKTGYQIKEPLEVFAQLQQDGRSLPDADAYEQYTCTLEVYRDGDDEVKEIPLSYDPERNGFSYRVMVENYGIYYARVVFRCGSAVSVVSETEIWDFSNETPVAPNEQEIPVMLGLFSTGIAEVDLAALVEDEERIPEENITVNYGRYDPAACTREGNILTVDATIGGSGSIYVTYRDIGGAETMTELKIVYTDNSQRDILILAAVIVLLVLLWKLLGWFRRKSMKLEGKLMLDLPIGDQTCPLQLDAQQAVGYDLNKLLRRNRYDLLVQARRLDYSDEQVDAFLRRHRGRLARIKISSVRDREHGIERCRIAGAEGRGSVQELSPQEEYVLIELKGCRTPMRVTYDRYSC